MHCSNLPLDLTKPKYKSRLHVCNTYFTILTAYALAPLHRPDIIMAPSFERLDSCLWEQCLNLNSFEGIALNQYNAAD